MFRICLADIGKKSIDFLLLHDFITNLINDYKQAAKKMAVLMCFNECCFCCIGQYLILTGLIGLIYYIINCWIWKEKKKKHSALPESSKSIKSQPKLLMVILLVISEVLAKLIKKVAVGSKIFELCLWSDSNIYE